MRRLLATALLALSGMTPLLAEDASTPPRAASMAAPPASARTAPGSPESDALLRAMLIEIRRVGQLTRYGIAPYFVELGIDEADNVTLSSSLGASFAPQRSRFRLQMPDVRVGAPTMDDTGYVGSDRYTGTRFDSELISTDNDLYSLRAAFWLGLDRAYKMGVEAIGKKQAALSYYTTQDRLPDFQSAPRVAILKDLRKTPFDEARWDERVRALSAAFRTVPGILSADSELSWSGGAFYYCNSEGSVMRFPDRMAILKLRVSAALEKGGDVYHGIQFVAPDPAGLPSDAELKREAEETAAELKALAQAPEAEAYTGPVLFEAPAAAQLFAEVFGQELSILRKPVAEKGREAPVPQSSLENKLGSRVLPAWLSLRDDATRKEWNGVALAGFYEADLDGVVPSPVTLVENGILKSYLTTRQPVKGVSGSNGHARLPGSFGARTARPGNLFVEARETLSDAQLKLRMIDMLKQQSKPYGLLIRRMDFPSLAPVSAVREMAMKQMRSGGGSRLYSAPLLAYRLYADGRQELVRGLRFKGLDVRLFKDILAAGATPAAFQYVENGAPMALAGAGSWVVGCASIAPAMLFEEMDLEPASDETAKPPLVPPPPMTK
ncbi:MAG: metallopeptidase TldD-related protein [Bryobacteraceae bacterium]|nr:metallopeptidase TldD-related protein [Bryobacteraceae bacterium]